MARIHYMQINILKVIALLQLNKVTGFSYPKIHKIHKTVAMAQRPAEIIKQLSSAYTNYGDDWTITDLNKHLKMHDIDSASLVVKEGQIQGAIVFDTHYTEKIIGENLHAIKSIPELTQGLIESLDKYQINYDITDITQNSFFNFIPLPLQLIGIYLFGSLNFAIPL